MEDRAKEYARIKYGLAIIDLIFLLCLLLILQISGFGRILHNMCRGITSSEALIIAIYSAILFFLYAALSFPLDFYRSFTVEHKFGLTKQKISSWLLDYVKGNALRLLLFILLIEGFYLFIRNYSASWWWMSACFWIFLSIVIARIFPVVIIPIFFKVKLIGDVSLKDRIMKLAEKMRVKILDVFEIDFSKKSLKANAAFVGLGRSKRVLLTDTLLSGKFTPEEIEVILAHEFAHYRLKHMIKIVSINAFVVLLAFYIFFELDNRVFTGLGMAIRDISNIGLWMFLFVLFQAAFSPVQNLISRNMERSADRNAIKITGNAGAFISMMEKLSEQNLSEKLPPLWAKILFYDHPPAGERIDLAKKELI